MPACERPAEIPPYQPAEGSAAPVTLSAPALCGCADACAGTKAAATIEARINTPNEFAALPGPPGDRIFDMNIY
jgi:hypothetical protein